MLLSFLILMHPSKVMLAWHRTGCASLFPHSYAPVQSEACVASYRLCFSLSSFLCTRPKRSLLGIVQAVLLSFLILMHPSKVKLAWHRTGCASLFPHSYAPVQSEACVASYRLCFSLSSFLCTRPKRSLRGIVQAGLLSFLILVHPP